MHYKGKTRYLCNFLRQQYRVSVCQYLPADALDQVVVAAFFTALAPVELDAYAQAVATQQQQQVQLNQAHAQQLSRLRYEAELAQRQFSHVDPDNRLVAATLERRWEEALRALQEAEASTTCVALPQDFVLLGRVLATLGGLIVRSRPSVDLATAILPALTRAMAPQPTASA